MPSHANGQGRPQGLRAPRVPGRGLRLLLQVLLLALVLLLAGQGAKARRSLPSSLRAAGFQVLLTGPPVPGTREATVVVPFAIGTRRTARVNGNPDTGKLVSGRFLEPTTLKAGRFTFHLQNAWYDREADCFQGAGTVRGLPVPFDAEEVQFDWRGLRAVRGLRNTATWRVHGLAFDPDEATWESGRLRFRGRLAAPPYPEVFVTVGTDGVRFQGPEEPVLSVERGQAVRLTGFEPGPDGRMTVDVRMGDRTLADRPFTPRGVQGLPAPPPPPSLTPPPSAAPLPPPARQARQAGRLPGSERFEAHWAGRGLLTARMASGVPTTPAGQEPGEGYRMVPSAYLRLPAPLDRLNVAGAPLSTSNEVFLHDPRVRMFWDHRYADVTMAFPPLFRWTEPVRLGERCTVAWKAPTFDGRESAMIQASLSPAEGTPESAPEASPEPSPDATPSPDALPSPTAEALAIRDDFLAASPKYVRADAHEAQFLYESPGGKPWTLIDLGWLLKITVHLDKPYQSMLAHFHDGNLGYKIEGPLCPTIVWESGGYKTVLLSPLGKNPNFLLRSSTTGFLQLNAAAGLALWAVPDQVYLENPQLKLLFLPVPKPENPLGTLHGSLELDRLEAHLEDLKAEVKDFALKFSFLAPQVWGLSGKATANLAFSNWIGTFFNFPDDAPIDFWFGYNRQRAHMEGFFRLFGKVKLKVIPLAKAWDPVAYLRLSPGAAKNEEHLVDAYVHAEVTWIERVVRVWYYANGDSDWSLNKSDEPIPSPPTPFAGPEDHMEWTGNLRVFGLPMSCDFVLDVDPKGHEIRSFVKFGRLGLEGADDEGNRFAVPRLETRTPEPGERNYDLASGSFVPGASFTGMAEGALNCRKLPGRRLVLRQGGTLTWRAGGELSFDSPFQVPLEGGGNATVQVLLLEAGRKGRLLVQVTYEDGQVDEYEFEPKAWEPKPAS